MIHSDSALTASGVRSLAPILSNLLIKRHSGAFFSQASFFKQLFDQKRKAISPQSEIKEEKELVNRSLLANTYGSAFPLRMDFDRQIISRFQRPPGPIPSSMLGYEALTGGLEDFGFEDYLNDPRESETFRPLDMHHGMEVRLGVSKGPTCPSFI